MTDPSGYPMNHPINPTDKSDRIIIRLLTDGSSDIRIDRIRIAPLGQSLGWKYLTAVFVKLTAKCSLNIYALLVFIESPSLLKGLRL